MILLGVLHCLRGRDLLPRWAYFLLAGLLAGLSSGSAVQGLIVAAGLALWLSTGWGNGLIAVTGRDTRDPTECPWLYKLCNRIIGEPKTEEAVRRWGGCFMSLRGTYLYPMFVGLAILNASCLPLLVGLDCLLQGPVYYAAGKLVPEKYAVAASEFTFGTILGFLIQLCI